LPGGPGNKELSRALETVCGIDIDPKALSNKVGRGTFSFAFFLQCMKALGVPINGEEAHTSVSLGEERWPVTVVVRLLEW
jgi:hypothetical protein